MFPKNLSSKITLVFLAAASAGLAQPPTNRYALILDEPAAAERFAGREALRSAQGVDYRRQIEVRQQALREDLAARNIRVTGSVSTVLNAVFVAAPPDRVAELQGLSGVKGVVPLRRFARNLNQAMPLLNVPAAWSALGGAQMAGAGIKIAILDSGIDQTHAMFQDPSLTMPAGFPKCNVPSDCAHFTNNKVIVARSYVPLMAAGSNPASPAVDSRPDDLSARDHDGHGTSVAATAAGNTTNAVLTIRGVAPKAYLGNYKVYGSPGVNDFPPIDVAIRAIEDALNDGMDVASFSSGYPALTGPLDTGAACGNPAGVPCDLLAQAFEKAAQAGMVVVASAGNDGYSGYYYPIFNTVGSPADAPSVIAVGGTTNAHNFFETVNVPDGPANLQGIVTASGDATVFYPGAVTYPLIDVTQLGDDGLLCSPLPDVGLGALYGYIVLVKRGTCNFSTKVENAQNAGAEAVILYMADQSTLVSPLGLSSFIPTVMISNTDGVNLKNFVDVSLLHLVTIDPAGSEQADTADQNLLVGYSSNGPSTGDSLVKPEIVAVAGDPSFFNYVYTAAETYDPAGELFSSTGYAVSAGTSYSAPMVSGAAALVRQRHPGYTAAQIRSALINTATQDVQYDDSFPATGGQYDAIPVDVQWMGAGKLDAGSALNANVAVSPTTLSFGLLTATSLPITKSLQFTNIGSSSVTLSLTTTVYPGETSSALVSFDHSSLTLAAGASGIIIVTLSGAVPPSQEYSGLIIVQGSGAVLNIPYMYIVPDGIPGNLFPLGGNFDGLAGQGAAPIASLPSPLAVKLTDDYGAPIAGAAVTFATFGGSSIKNADQVTNAYGIATATPVLGSTPGNYTFRITAGGMSQTVTGYARLAPSITTVENGASFDATKPIAAGSYITIKGTGLSDYTDLATTARLPLQIDYVTVSFDVPSTGISVPGYPTYVSPTQLNVWVPWELQNQSSVNVKVTINYTPGNVVTVPLATYSPAFFPVGGFAAARDLNYAVITATNPAIHGNVVQLYANGLGPVTNQVASGDPAAGAPLLSETTTKCTASIGGQPAEVGFCGLAPGFPGLYQANVTVPSGLIPGTYPVTITVGGQTSPAAMLPVQ